MDTIQEKVDAKEVTAKEVPKPMDVMDKLEILMAIRRGEHAGNEELIRELAEAAIDEIIGRSSAKEVSHMNQALGEMKETLKQFVHLLQVAGQSASTIQPRPQFQQQQYPQPQQQQPQPQMQPQSAYQPRASSLSSDDVVDFSAGGCS